MLNLLERGRGPPVGRRGLCGKCAGAGATGARSRASRCVRGVLHALFSGVSVSRVRRREEISVANEWVPGLKTRSALSRRNAAFDWLGSRGMCHREWDCAGSVQGGSREETRRRCRGISRTCCSTPPQWGQGRGAVRLRVSWSGLSSSVVPGGWPASVWWSCSATPRALRAMSRVCARLRIPVKVISDSGLNVISESGQSGHRSERSDAGVGL